MHCTTLSVQNAEWHKSSISQMVRDRPMVPVER